MNKRISTLTILMLWSLMMVAQQWTDHLNLNSASFCGKIGNKPYAGSSMGLFTYDDQDHLIEKITKVNLLNDTEISTIDTDGERLFIGYINGNLDIVSGNSVVNIPDIKLSNIPSSKTINRIVHDNNKLYCCTNFGIVVINIQRREVTDTYYIGTETENFSINTILFHDKWIYAATNKGLFRADKESSSLSYYNNWMNIGGDALAYSELLLFNSNIAAFRGKRGVSNDLRILTQQGWKQTLTISNFSTATTIGNDLLITNTDAVYSLGDNNNMIPMFTNYTFNGKQSEKINISDIRYDKENKNLIVADRTYGMVICNMAGEGIHLSPNAPASNNSLVLASTPKGIYSLAGGHTPLWNNNNYRGEFSYLTDGQWSSYISNKFPQEKDLVNIAVNPTATDSIYLCSWGTGILKIEDTKVVQHYNQFNSPLQNIASLTPEYVRVGAACYDKESNLIMTNAEVSPGLWAKTPQNKWYPLSYPPMNQAHSVSHLITTRDNIVWAVMPASKPGLFVFSTNKSIDNPADDQYRSILTRYEDNDPRNKGQLLLWDENREVITNKISAICEDKNGQIWLGTEKGVLVYYRPSAIFTTEYPVAARIKVPRNDGTNAADYLLGNETVTTICVDGANRKWIGTANAGLFLVSPDGMETIHSFNTHNSPLLSNKITSIAIAPKGGEVFIATDKGIVSFKGDAIEPAEKASRLKIYPNPVKPNFSGNITIDGFSADSEVVITDIAGNMVHKAISRGGRITWNGLNLNGNKVSTGVYLILAADSEGNNTIAGKILFVR